LGRMDFQSILTWASFLVEKGAFFMSRLLINEQPLMVLPSLAKAVGLNEAIILQQIHYWTEINRQAGRNYMDGRFWVYNSYAEWEQQFPFWSRNTIIRAINSLEKQGLIISANHNKNAFDRTKWYAIDYEALAVLEQKLLRPEDPQAQPNYGTTGQPNEDSPSESDKDNEGDQAKATTEKDAEDAALPDLPKMGRSIYHTEDQWHEAHLPKMGNSSTQNGLLDQRSMGKPIPEINQRLTAETLSLSSKSEQAASLDVELHKTNSDELVERESPNLDLETGNSSNDDLAVMMTADRLIEFWNEQEVNPHRGLKERTIKRIESAWKRALDEFSAEEILTAILNYSDAYKSGRAAHKYRLVEFLERRGYEHFMIRENWIGRSHSATKITRDDFTYTSTEQLATYDHQLAMEDFEGQLEKPEKPFEDVDSEVRRRVAEYEAQLRRVGFYSERDIRDMVKEYQVLCRYRVNEEYARWERRSAELPND